MKNNLKLYTLFIASHSTAEKQILTCVLFNAESEAKQT